MNRKKLWSIVCKGFSKRPMYPFSRIAKVSEKIEKLEEAGKIKEACQLNKNLEDYKNKISKELSRG